MQLEKSRLLENLLEQVPSFVNIWNINEMKKETYKLKNI